jgi:hypothetical protein
VVQGAVRGDTGEVWAAVMIQAIPLVPPHVGKEAHPQKLESFRKP